MFYLNKIIFSKKKIILKTFPWIWIFGTLILTLLIYFTSREIQLWPPDLSAAGLNLFVKVFKIPIYYFVGCIPIFGIILTVERMNQTEKQTEILLNNYYYQHLEKFIANMKDSVESEINDIRGHNNLPSLEAFCRMQHRLWYGDMNSFEGKAKESTVQSAKEIVHIFAETRNQLELGEDLNKLNFELFAKRLYGLGIYFQKNIIKSMETGNPDELIRDACIILNCILRDSGENT